MVDLYEKVSFLGEQVTTADELRAAKKAFASVVDSTTDVAAAARQSAQDIRSRKTNKQSNANKEEAKAKDALARQANNSRSPRLRLKPKAWHTKRKNRPMPRRLRWQRMWA